jgi:hypothetical protein
MGGFGYTVYRVLVWHYSGTFVFGFCSCMVVANLALYFLVCGPHIFQHLLGWSIGIWYWILIIYKFRGLLCCACWCEVYGCGVLYNIVVCVAMYLVVSFCIVSSLCWGKHWQQSRLPSKKTFSAPLIVMICNPWCHFDWDFFYILLAY